MKITRTPLLLDSKKYSREYGVVRSEGAHLMQIVERILRRGEKKEYDDWDDDHLNGLQTPGFIWERVMSEHASEVHQQKLIEVGEMWWCQKCDESMAGGSVAQYHYEQYGSQHKGIFFTPDFVCTERDGKPAWFPIEMKFTWKSSRRTTDTDVDGIPMWLMQLQWQCMGLGSNEAQLQALFCRADYSPGPPRTHAYVFDFEFNDRDIARNKAMIISNAKAEGLL